MTREIDRYAIRPGRASDAVELAALQASVQLQHVTGGQPHPGIAAWVEDLLDGHPSVAPGDFLVAEDSATGRPVASLVGLRQDWSLAGVRLPVAQIELVGTAPEHRGNRLTERLFDSLHQRYAAAGVPVQFIEGIPYFYRRLGYDYALANDGAPTVPALALPTAGHDRAAEGGDLNVHPATGRDRAPEGGDLNVHPATGRDRAPEGGDLNVRPTAGHDRVAEDGGLNVRPATVADAGDLAAIDRRLADGDALVCPRDAEVWRYEITGRRPADLIGRAVAVLVQGADIRGYLVHTARLNAAGELAVVAAACARPADWPRAAAAMHAHLGNVGRQYQASAGRPFAAVRFLLDPEHPLARFGPPGIPRRPRGWYARAGDPVDLLARLVPLLRDRWRAADLRWPEPALTIDMYGRAAQLEFSDGELKTVMAMRGTVSPSTDPQTHAAIPPGALLQLAFGHRTLPEVLEEWPDCLPRDRLTEHFLTAAFPRVPVRVWPRN